MCQTAGRMPLAALNVPNESTFEEFHDTGGCKLAYLACVAIATLHGDSMPAS